MKESPPKPLLALGAGLAGAAIVAACICVSGFLLLSGAGWAGVDPALLDALALPVLAVGLVVIALVALANGVTWCILVWKQGRRAVLWMLLSLCCALAVPYVLPLAVIFAASGAQLGDVLCVCGVPGAIAGLLVLAFWFSLPRQPAKTETEKATSPESDLPAGHEPGRNEPSDLPVARVQEAGSSGQTGYVEVAATPSKGCLGDLITFGLGLAVPILTAGGILLLLYLVSILLLDAQAIVPARGNPRHLAEILAIAYLLLAPVVASIISLLASLVLTLIIVVPRISSRAGKVINTILFSLLSAALGLLFGFAVVARLFSQYNPEWWR